MNSQSMDNHNFIHEYRSHLESIVASGVLKGEPVDVSWLKRSVGMIDAMTLDERSNPGKIDQSRERRIASGSGVTQDEVQHFVNVVLTTVGLRTGKLKLPTLREPLQRLRAFFIHPDNLEPPKTH